MCIPLSTGLGIASAGMQAYGAYQGAKSDKASLKAQRKAAEYNAQVAEQNARDAIFRGELSAQDVRRSADQLRGAQRAAFAGQGVDVNYGTAGDIQDDTTFFGEIDVARTRYNAANEAIGLRQQGERATQQAAEYGRAARSVSPLLNAGATLVGGLAPVASQWYQNRPPSGASATARTNAILGR